MNRRNTLSTLLLMLFLSPLLCARTGGDAPAPRTERLMSGNPLGGAFYENRGQIIDTEGERPTDILYYALFDGARLYFTPRGWHTVYTVSEPQQAEISEATGQDASAKMNDPLSRSGAGLEGHRSKGFRMDMTFVGCNEDVLIEAEETLPRYLNYYLGHCRDGITRVPAHRTLRYRNLYNNIDLLLHATREGLKYEFEVRPGGRVKDIRMRHEGMDGIEQTNDGRLLLCWPGGYTQEGRPFTYQEREDGLTEVQSFYVVDGDVIGFNVEEYESSRTLVIDPWSTYYGGSWEDIVYGLTSDPQNAIIVAGLTKSRDFPVQRAWQPTFKDYADAFVVKFDSSGQVAWATYFGGSKNLYQAADFDAGYGVASDRWGNIVLCGVTKCIDLPVTMYAYQSQLKGVQDAFLAKFDSSGIRLWATYLGGDGHLNNDALLDVGTDSLGNIYAVGRTTATNFPTMNAYQSMPAGAYPDYDMVYLKMTGIGTLHFSSYFGGTESDGGVGIAVEPSGSFVITGGTMSADVPLRNAWQPTFGGKTDAFVAMFTTTGTPQWSSYLGGSEDDGGYGVAFDGKGDILVSGYTRSADFPIRNAWQPLLNGGDAMVAKFNRQGALRWSTYFGGSNGERFNAVTADAECNVYVAGLTNSTDFPTMLAAYPALADSSTSDIGDGMVVKFDSTGSRIWSTYLGGNARDEIIGIALDGSGRVYVAGETRSRDFPVFNAVRSSMPSKKLHPSHSYMEAIFVTRITPDGRIPVTLTAIRARRLQSGVELTWRTESEVNAYGFMIERRTLSQSVVSGWIDIGFVPAVAREFESHEYSSIDADPGVNDHALQYRLRMIDLDGSVEYSPVVEVGPSAVVTQVGFDIAYPTPARDWLTLGFKLPTELSVSLIVHDVTGREIARLHDHHLLASGAHSVALPTADWHSGLYLCTLTAGDTRIVRKVVVMK